MLCKASLAISPLLTIYAELVWQLILTPSYAYLDLLKDAYLLKEGENVLGLMSRSLFIGGGVTYHPLRDEVLISL